MKPHASKLRRRAAFTISELLLTTAVASLMMGGMMAGSVAVQRSFAASNRHALSQGDMYRVADYVARDIRSATVINTTVNGAVVLTITQNDFYDRKGTPTTTDDVPNTPTLGRYGAVYGAVPVTIRYSKVGTRISREVQTTNAGAVTTTSEWIADNLDSLSVTRDAQGVATITVSTTVRYKMSPGSAAIPKSVFVMKARPQNPST